MGREVEAKEKQLQKYPFKGRFHLHRSDILCGALIFFSQFLMGGGVREGDRYFGVYELKSAGWLPTLRTDSHS